MTVPEHARGYEGFRGRVGRTLASSRPAWPVDRPRDDRPGDGRPNVVVVLVDDMGFSDVGPYGSEIRTPTIDRLADEGIRFTNYHTTPLCSPSRAALLTGINPHRAGFAFPANYDPGYPSFAFELPHDAPTLAESLRAAGYATFAVGKWHLTRDGALHDAADRSSWPIQRGFDRYFGSMEGFTSLHAPHRLTWDNSPYEVERFPDGYFLTDDLTDRAIAMLRALRANDADKPFFLYVAHHAVHGPIQAKPTDIDTYRGVYDAGWDHIRQERFARQLATGLFPPGTVLPPFNAEPGRSVEHWDDLGVEERQRFARYMQVYAASVDNIDQNLGRLLGAIEQYGELDNTIVVFSSDNGATAEGGEDGTRSYFSRFAHVPGLPADWDGDVDRELDLVGGPQTTVHYPRGWGQASNTPFRLYKSDTFAGGVRVPLIVRWPAGGVRSAGDDGYRRQYVYVTDIAPTLLELAGVPRLTERHGHAALSEDGISATAIVRDGAAPTVHTTQYTETGGNRGYFRDGWKIVTNHVPGTPFDDDEWQLYDIATDPTETTNVGHRHPELLRELAAEWEAAAWHNTVFPLFDHSAALALRRPSDDQFGRAVTLYPHTPTLERYRSSRLIQLRDFVVTIAFQHREGDEGVLVAHGDQGGGYSVCVRGGAVILAYNAYGRLLRSSPVPVGTGEVIVTLTAEALAEFRWSLRLAAGAEVAELEPVPQLLGMAPFTGISVGADRGGPVDWEIHTCHGSFAYTGELHHVRYTPGEPADYDPRQLARLWAETARIYD